jgi:hypothetical protein
MLILFSQITGNKNKAKVVERNEDYFAIVKSMRKPLV